MRKVFCWIMGMLLLLSACSTPQLSEECRELADRLDHARETFDKDWVAWSKDKRDSWIGGTLINISITNQYIGYTFQGLQNIYVVRLSKVSDKEVPYKVGAFYKFHRKHEFELLRSAARSGEFFDPDYTALIPVDCKVEGLSNS